MVLAFFGEQRRPGQELAKVAGRIRYRSVASSQSRGAVVEEPDPRDECDCRWPCLPAPSVAILYVFTFTIPGFSAIIWNGGIAGLQRDARSAGSQLQWRLGGLHLRSVVASLSQIRSDDLAWERCLSP